MIKQCADGASPHTAFQARLLAWYRANGRDLPWRQTPANPYHVWLSEVIMQQTRIAQGTVYWQRFVERWPDVRLLAAADEQEVMRMWQGLGYYSRARHLLQAAREVAAAGGFPSTSGALERLPGVGPYTAAAIASICFGEACAVVDGNVVRVLSRLNAVDTPADTAHGMRLLRALARDVLPAVDAGEWNQAMMDFGAMVCTPKSPRCGDCPLSAECRALAEGKVATLPVKRERTKQRERRLVYVMVVRDGRVALHQRAGRDIWRGLWEPFLVEDAAGGGPLLPAWAATAEPLLMGVRHVLTHQRLTCDFWLLRADGALPPLPSDYRWVTMAEVDRYGLPRVVERVFGLLGDC